MPTPKEHPGWTEITLSLLWQCLFRMVERRYHWLDVALIEDAVSSVIVRRLEKEKDLPNNAEGTIAEVVLQDLYNSACREVGHLIRADRRRVDRQRAYASKKNPCSEGDFFVANRLSAGSIHIEDDLEKVESLLETLQPWEQHFVRMRIHGCKSLNLYARLLGIEASSVADQRQAVKRAWDRLLKRLHRRVKDQLENVKGMKNA